MAGPLSDKHFQVGMIRDEDYKAADNLFTGSQEYRSIWYRSRKEIENNSPSRKDGIDLRKEMHLRTVYCSFLQDLGMKLGVPQVTIATAMLFCHRFYLHQSHAKNDWQTIATVSMFLASKVEDTPCLLDKVVIVAYEMIYRRERAAAQRIHCKDVFEKQKTLIIIGERLLLSTIGFDFNIQHPYKPLVAAVKKLGITQKEVMRVAWNFVNDWFRTSLCLQYKPHYIAAGSIFLASKLHNVKLPSERGHVWWHEFDVTPQQLEEVIQEMMELLGYKTRAMLHPAHEKPNQTQLPTKEEASSSPESCVLSRPASSNNTSHELDGKVSHNPDSENVCVSGRVELQCQVKDSESPNSVLDVGEISGKGEDQERINPDVTERCSGIDRVRIKAMLMKRKVEREMNKKMIDMDDTNEDAWIERELETGIDLGAEPAEKKQRLSRG